MKKRASLALGFATLFQFVSSNLANAGIPPVFHSLVPEDITLITQNKGGSRTCGPTALLYALKFGNKSMRAAYGKIPGTSDEDKLKNLVNAQTEKPSSVSYHKMRLDPKTGMAAQNLFSMASELAPGLQLENFHREETETAAGALVKRIHRNLLQSIKNGVPVVAIWVPYLGTYVEANKTNLWSEHNGHYVVITGVPESIDEAGLGFSLQYVDPETGKAGLANMYEEVSRGFWARREKPDGAGEWIHTEVNNGKRTVASPYLGVLAPKLNLTPRTALDSQRVVVTLVSAVGNFSVGNSPR